MSNNFFYRPKEQLVRVNSPSSQGFYRQISPNPIANHQSPPASRVIHPLIQQNIHSEYFQVTIPKQILPQTMSKHPVSHQANLLSNHKPSEFEQNKAIRSNSEAIYSNTSPSAFAAAARSKGFSEFSPKMPSQLWSNNPISKEFFNYPPSPRQLQKIEPIRRISQHKTASSDAGQAPKDPDLPQKAFIKSTTRQEYYNELHTNSYQPSESKEVVTNSYTKILKNSRQLIDEIFENETNKALLQMNRVQSKCRQRRAKSRSTSHSKNI